MSDIVTLDYFLQQGFAIAVAIYLLYERTSLNTKMVSTLKEISLTLIDVKDELRELKKS